MSVSRRGRIWHYEFQIDGVRYRGSTKQTTEAKARQFEARLMAEVQQRGPSAIPRKAPILREFSARFLNWVEKDEYLKPASRKYYRWGWDTLSKTPIANMRLDRITRDAAAMVHIDGSPSWQNQAWRTLRRILGKAVEWDVLVKAPRIALADEVGRNGFMDDGMEDKLLEVAEQPLKDVLMVLRDTGMRPDEVFRMRWEHVQWDKSAYFNTKGKSRKARRWVPLTCRVMDALKARAGNKSEWVFQSKRAKSGHLTTIAKQFRQARKLAGLPEWLVPYHARHAFGTYAMAHVKDPSLVKDAMGHESLSTTMKYMHPDVDRLRDVIEQRNRRVM